MNTNSFHKDTWELYKSMELSKQLTVGETLAQLGDDYPEVVALCADLGKPTRLWDFGKKYSHRFFNFGLAEKNMVTAAAGLASTGKTPFVATYSSFLGILAAENIRTAVAYTNLNVRLIGTHTGIAMGFYGTSHHATEDISITRSMANMTVISPADGNALSEMVEESVTSYEGPIYFRVSRGREPTVYENSDKGTQNKIGQANVLRNGTDLTIIACGIQVESKIKEVALQYGKIDILINNAGISRPTKVTEIEEEEWDLVFNVNVKGVFFLTQAVIPYMKRNNYGRIISLSSVSGKRGGGIFGGSHYSAAKAGVTGFSKAVARETGKYGITCNTVAPGLVGGTQITNGLLSDEKKNDIQNNIPVGRLGKVEDIAYSLTFLASDGASYITGEELDINGGSHID